MRFVYATTVPLLLAGLLSLVNDRAFSQAAAPSADNVLQQVQNHLSYPDGLTRGKLTVIHTTGRTRILNFDLYKSQQDSLYVFQSRRRGMEEKILYNQAGETIWVFDALNKTLFQKIDNDKYKPALGSGYAYIDIASVTLRANYRPRLAGYENFEGSQYLKLELLPLRRRKYGKLVLLVDHKNQYKPVRLDYLDGNMLLIKSITFQFNKMRVIDEKRKSARTVKNTRRDLIHLNSGTISILEFFNSDRSVKPDRALFQNDNLNK